MFRVGKIEVPKVLNQSIERYFSLKQQRSRLKIFTYLTDPEKNIGMDELVLMSAPKVNHGKFSSRYRGSEYRGVSKNGKSWQILIMIDNEKIYLCTNDDPHQAAILYDFVII